MFHFLDFNKKEALRSPEARKLFAGEASQWDTPSFGRLATAPDKVVMVGEKSAVARVQWYGEGKQVTDLYFYLTFNTSWKIETMRALALTGIVEMVYLELKSKPSLSQAERAEMRNLELTLAPDSVLHDWFSKNRAVFSNLVALAQNRPGLRSVSAKPDKDSYPEISKLLRDLHVSVLDVSNSGNISIVIGGVTDNTVGFLYSPANRPPPIDPSSYIWVEQVADKWFLFRTT